MTDELHDLLVDLAGPPTVLDPDAVRARARRLQTARHRRRLAIGAVAAAAVIVVGSVVALRPGDDPDGRLDVTDTSEVAPTTVAPTGWVELARMPTAQYSEANTMQDDGRSLVWTGSLVVVPGVSEAITFDPASGEFGSLPAAPVSLVNDQRTSSYQGVLPWVWTGEEIIRIDPTPLPPDASGNTGVGPLVGQAYSPATGTWRRMADPPVEHLVGIAWADDQLLGWSREGVHAYHPETDAWELLTAEAGPTTGRSETAAWTGAELVVVGRFSSAAFDPAARTWRTLPPSTSEPGVEVPTTDPGSPSGTTLGATGLLPDIVRVQWTGSEVIAYDGAAGTISRLDLAAGTWHVGPSNGMVGRQSTRSALWTGERFVVWGGSVHEIVPNGSNFAGYASDGAAWDPVTDSWQPIADLPADSIPMNGVLADDRFLAFFQMGADGDDVAFLQLHP